mmetsp:Transcript_11128/g.25774  ORF Transcript_11128/g.25774 Transcript_11128/m.25774 type:complete len:109 (+) Transcript_11128:322-648(+)
MTIWMKGQESFTDNNSSNDNLRTRECVNNGKKNGMMKIPSNTTQGNEGVKRNNQKGVKYPPALQSRHPRRCKIPTRAKIFEWAEKKHVCVCALETRVFQVRKAYFFFE